MGEGIDGGTRADDIVRRLRAALASCSEKGGAFRRIAEERLAPAAALVDAIARELGKARDSAAPALAALTPASRSAGARIAEVFDALRSAVGRPEKDAALALLFPGGPAYYSDGNADEQADRMELLAQLLEAGVHPKVEPEAARALAGKVRAAATSLRAAVDAARLPRARVSLLERAVITVVNSAESELASLRRRFAAEGLSADEIDSVLTPDREGAAASPPTTPHSLKLA